MHAQRKGRAFERIEVRYEHDRVHADDCVDRDQRHDGHIARAVSDITIHGDRDAGQREPLFQVAARCPMHKTLERGLHLVDAVDFA